jgi:hypothetical protein
VDLDLGIRNKNAVIDTDAAEVVDGDSIFRMVQRGGTENIDTPIVNPRYRFASADDFDTELGAALKDLRMLRDEDVDFNTRNLEVLSDDLLLISLWKNDTLGDSNQIDGPDYLGDSDVLRERSEVTVRNVDFSGKSERLRVLKLRPEKDGGDWQWFQVDDLSDSEDITGSDGNYTVRFEVSPRTGFSVFQIVVSGVVKDASAEEAVVYPNPFVPHDNNDQTGCYSCSRSGIYFGAGPDRGFPSGTRIKIYTIKGELVDEFSLFTGGILNWDARTRSGERVASGVYIYRIETPDGGELNGKFAIVR